MLLQEKIRDSEGSSTSYSPSSMTLLSFDLALPEGGFFGVWSGGICTGRRIQGLPKEDDRLVHMPLRMVRPEDSVKFFVPIRNNE